MYPSWRVDQGVQTYSLDRGQGDCNTQKEEVETTKGWEAIHRKSIPKDLKYQPRKETLYLRCYGR